MYRMQRSAEGPRLLFLVVDDDSVLCCEMGRILLALGDVVRTESLADAHHALDTIRELAGAVVDVLLKPGNGIDLVDRLQVERPGLPILVITGDLVPERVNDACLRGVEFLAKPFETEVLRAWAARVLEQWRRSMPPCALPNDLPEDLRALARRVIAAASGVSASQGTYVDRLAALARAASGRRLADRSATAACAEAIGVSRQVLQAAGSVGARVAQPEIQGLFSRRDCNGRHITPSHLTAVSRLPHSTQAQLIDRIFSEGLGVQEAHCLADQLGSLPGNREDKSH